MTSTEIELRHSPGTVTVSEEFAASFPAIAPDPELAELMADSLGDMELSPRDLPRVKVPSGGGLLWTTVVEGKATGTDALEGVLTYFRKQRAFWTDPNPKGNAPDCTSLDGRAPVPGGMYAAGGERADQNPAHLCKTCPMFQPGTDLKGGRGAGCKDQRALFLVKKNEVLPTVVTVPPSSVRSFEQFIIGLVNTRTGWWSVTVSLTLEEASNAAGDKFARIKVTPTGKLSADEAKAVKDFGEYIKNMVASADPAEFIDSGAPADVEAQGVTIDDPEDDER